jgi:hypothetical protein
MYLLSALRGLQLLAIRSRPYSTLSSAIITSFDNKVIIVRRLRSSVGFSRNSFSVWLNKFQATTHGFNLCSH